MRYSEAIAICDNIDAERMGNHDIDDDARLSAIETILGMATINAVRKDTLLKVIRWFWDNCVDTITEVDK